MTLTGALLVAVAVLSLAWPGGAFAISRNDVLARAQKWVDDPVTYSQSKYHDGYRTDCSGFASMAWKLSSSYTTRSMHNVATKILVADLKPGDAMLKSDYHIRIFYGWVDPAHTGKDPLARYIAYEQTGPTTKSSSKSMAQDIDYGYRAFRYKNITNSSPSKNLVLNPTFDVWDWSYKYDKFRQSPVWWSVSGYDPMAVAVHGRKYHQTSSSSLKLCNPATAPGVFVEVSQSVTVTANAGYTLSAWARTDGEPRSVELRVRYLDASGALLGERTTRGDESALDTLAFKSMKFAVVTPPGTARASIAMRLGGGARPTTASVGVTAYLDDLSLTSTPVTSTRLSLSRSAATIVHGHSVVLSGKLDPDAAGPAPIRIQYKRPGSTEWVTWRYVPSDSDGSYRTTWSTGSTTTKGTWWWRAHFEAAESYLGTGSAPVTVHVD